MLWILSIFCILLLILAIFLLYSNKKLTDNIKVLKKTLALKDTTIENFEASRLLVKDVMESFPYYDKVVTLLKEGNDRKAIAKKLNIDMDKITIIVKMNILEKEND